MSGRDRLAIADIIVGERHRRDLGNVDSLGASIAEVGLLHPIVVAADGTLIAGARRLEAVKRLGWANIPVTVVALDNVVRGEFAENTARKDFTLSEAVAIKRALEPIEQAAAKERLVESGRVGGKGLGNFPDPSKGRALDKVAKVVGKDRTTIAKAEAMLLRETGGAWLVLALEHGWLHGDRCAALADAQWLGRNLGLPVRETDDRSRP